MLMSLFTLLLVLLAGVGASGQNSHPAPKPAPVKPRPARGRLDAAAQRNENVPVYQIDNNAVKELNIRFGNTATIVPEAPVEASYFAAEVGRPAGETFLLRPPVRQPAWHGEMFEWHQNGVFNARTFFQVGSVLPSHRNYYGGRFTGNLGRLGNLTAGASQRAVRGMVNGNVLVPLASERTPLATDPDVRAMISRFLAAYPQSLPNRPDFDIRALNTNAPQNIDEVEGNLRLDRDTSAGSKLSLFYSLLRQRIHAFQLVAGQNPDTEIHTHRSQLNWRAALSADTDLALGFAFLRTKSVLLPEPNAVGPRVRMGFQIQELGPDSEFPIDRAQNSFRWGALVERQIGGGRHAVTFGGDIARFQLNGIETNNQRGYITFSNNFGRSAIQNFLLGTPSFYEVTIGELARGFRNWSANAFVADRWKVNSRVQIYYGLRYGLDSAPREVDNLSQIPYGCDCNNFSPRLSLAYQAPHGWVVRASYGISFSQIQPVTYQQIRNNLPLVHYFQVQNPDLLDPLRGLSLDDPNARTTPTFLSRDLVSPYSHQYNFSLERRLAGGSMLRLGYIGSRSVKMLNSYILNRAEPPADLKYLRLDTVNARRPDPRYYEVRQIVNGGRAYFDAAQVSLDMPLQRGLRWNVSYTFSKAIDEGSDFSGTAANGDLLRGRSQWQYDSLADKKGLSNFDSPHALLLTYSYDFPRLSAGRGWLHWLANNWQVSGVSLLKSGTPLTLYVGSDAPGFGNVDGGPSDRPNVIDPSILGRTISNPDVAPLILRRDRFAYITPGEHRGSVARNAFRKARIANFNAAITKQWHWGNRREWTALLRGEAYNLSNTPQFDEPQRNLSSPAFGKITNTLNDGRVFQIGLRLVL
jgi:hypothetical protein